MKSISLLVNMLTINQLCHKSFDADQFQPFKKTTNNQISKIFPLACVGRKQVTVRYPIRYFIVRYNADSKQRNTRLLFLTDVKHSVSDILLLNRERQRANGTHVIVQWFDEVIRLNARLILKRNCCQELWSMRGHTCPLCDICISPPNWAFSISKLW